jgi:molybdopterin/thiamine biosynthesis adenylyltransferase
MVEYLSDLKEKDTRSAASFSVDITNKLKKQNALVIGLKGTGSEIVKHLILNGINKTYIYDENPISTLDIGSNFFCDTN